VEWQGKAVTVITTALILAIVVIVLLAFAAQRLLSAG
jgi:hypothetical protein